MQKPAKSYATKLLLFLIGAVCVLVLLQLLLKYISVVQYNEQHGFLFELANRFDMNDESSVPQWLTQALFLAIAGGAALAAYLADKRGERRFWIVVAVLGLVLSIDDVATLHEFVLQSLHNELFLDQESTFLHNTWFILLPFILIGFSWLCFSMVRHLPRRTVVLLVSAGIIFISGAVIVDSFANTVPPRSYAGQGVYGAIEGGLQLLGSSLFLFGIVDYIERKHGQSVRRALRQLKT